MRPCLLSWLLGHEEKDEGPQWTDCRVKFLSALTRAAEQSSATHTIETCRSDLQPQMAL